MYDEDPVKRRPMSIPTTSTFAGEARSARFPGMLSARILAGMTRALVLVFVFIGAVTLGCGKQQPTSSHDASSEDPCKGPVESGVPCVKEGATCRFTGRLSDISPVSALTEPPLCFCSNKTWACPSVASPPPADH